MSGIDKFKDTFREEAHELLANLEDYMLELESKPEDPELLSAVFRVMHTIKGSSAMFGFDLISRFTHDIESIMDDVRSGKIEINKMLIDLTLQSKDLIKELLDPDLEDTSVFTDRVNVLLSAFHQEVAGSGSADDGDSLPEKENESDSKSYSIDEERTYRILFTPDDDIFLSGTKPVMLLEELQLMGSYTSVAHMEKVPSLDKIDPEKCYISWEIAVTTAVPLNEIREVFIFIENDSKITFELIEDYSEEDAEPKRIGEILLNKGIIEPETIETALKSQRKIGEVLLDNNILSEEDLEAALQEQTQIRQVKEKKTQTQNTIRVDSHKLDELVDLVGELVTLQARFTQMANHKKDTAFVSVSEHLERLSSDLRDNTMSLRMLPIGTTFSRYKRLVRDLSTELGKEIELFAEGGETELDKSVLDRLNDPLVHIIRNSIGHGIEIPSVRKKNGKNNVGNITLRAKHSGAFVEITIEDDGAGIDAKELVKKAVANNIISSSDVLKEKEIFDLIFSAGFSTAKEVTSVSGRGVGMDVVKKEIDALRGSVSVESNLGEGTRIILSIPLTLAIIEGLLIRIENDYFVIPLNSVEACIELTAEEQDLHPNRNVINYRGSILPYIRIKDTFEIEGERKDIEQIVVIHSNDSICGFVVDEVVGDYQTVIKSLGFVYRNIEGVSGATILGDGSIALILDIAKLSLIAKEQEKIKLSNEQ